MRIVGGGLYILFLPFSQKRGKIAILAEKGELLWIKD